MRPAGCPETRIALSVWSPEGTDLPDSIALHMDACPTCAAAFAARFPPWDFAIAAPAPPPLPRRMGSGSTWAGALGGLATIAAAALLTLGGQPPTPHAVDSMAALLSPDESPLTAEEQLLVPECLLHSLDDLELVCPPGDDSEWL